MCHELFVISNWWCWRPTRMRASERNSHHCFDKKTHSFLMVLLAFAISMMEMKFLLCGNVKRMRKRVPQLLRSQPNDRSMAKRARTHATPHFAYWVRANEGRMSSSSSSFTRWSQTVLHSGRSIWFSFDGLLARKFVLHAQTVCWFVICNFTTYFYGPFFRSLSFYRSEMSRNRNVSGFTMLETTKSSVMKSGHGQAIGRQSEAKRFPSDV